MDHQYSESSAYNEYICTNEELNEKENVISIEEKDGDAFLIELYRERPFLYNKAHKDFKNKIIKDNAWNEVSKIMQNGNYGKSLTLYFN